MLHRYICLLLIATLILVAPARVAAMPAISSEAAVLVDMETGEILGGINVNKQVYPASTAKILTALIAVERGNLDDMVTVSSLASRQEGTSLYSKAGEQYLFEDLLYALLVHSANDAAVALAEHVAGSVEAFAELMNEKAAALGAEGSNFVNPNGLHDKDHYTTAADMAKIFAAALKNPVLQEITTTCVYYIDLPSGERRTLINGNKMLTEYSGTIGGKTGYTRQAGNCLLTAAQKGSLKLGVTLFKAQGKAMWSDAQRLLDYGFANWSSHSLAEPGQVITAVPTRYGSDALLVSGGELHVTLPKEEQDPAFHWEINLDKPLKAPLAMGQVVGSATYFIEDREIGSVQLQVAHAVPRLWYTYWELVLLTFFAGGIIRWRNASKSKRQT